MNMEALQPDRAITRSPLTFERGAHRLSGARSQQATVSGKKAGGQSSGRNFSTNFPMFRPKS